MSNKLKYTNDSFVIREKEVGDLLYLTFPIFEQYEELIHGFSTRLGGVSTGIYDSMNLSFSRGDDEELVEENFQRMANALGVEKESYVFSVQTHTTNVRKVTLEDRGKGIVRPIDYNDVDGLITNVPGVTLTTFYADCVPLFLYDPVKKVIGLSHSGWRGTVGKIGKVTVEMMAEEYGCDPKDIRVAVGPSICQDCYEVSEDVIEEFKMNFEEVHWNSLFYKKENGKYQLNLWKANEIIFQEAGVLSEHIAVSNVCTYCNSELLYSHRASKGQRGSLAAFAALKKE